MTKVELYGWGVDLKVMEITPELVKELTEVGVSPDRLMEIQDELSNSMAMWSGITPDPRMFTIYVNDEEISEEILNAIPVKELPEGGVAYDRPHLVIADSNKGCWFSIESDKPFTPSLLMFEAREVELPSCEHYQFMDLYFDGKSEFGEPDGKDSDVYVITADGERREILEIEED